jgi:hypothetical protein
MMSIFAVGKTVMRHIEGLTQLACRWRRGSGPGPDSDWDHDLELRSTSLLQWQELQVPSRGHHMGRRFVELTSVAVNVRFAAIISLRRLSVVGRPAPVVRAISPPTSGHPSWLAKYRSAVQQAVFARRRRWSEAVRAAVKAWGLPIQSAEPAV